MTSEKIQVKDFREMLLILDKEEVSRNPKYTGYGIEVYQNNDLEIQVVYNTRGDNREVLIHRGF